MNELTQEQKFKFRYRMEQEAEQATGQPAPAPIEASEVDKWVGSIPGRLALGAASPLIGAAQLGANVGSAISSVLPGHVEGGPMSGPWVNEKLAELEASKQRGMKAAGKEGFDWYGLAGSLLPGAAMVKGMSAALPTATSALGRIGTGAAIGGATSAAQPVTSPDFWTDKAKQVGVGTAVGAAIPAVAEALRAAKGVPQLNPTKAATLKEGQAAGYVVPPSSVNPSFLNNRLESVAGKASVGQEAAKRNQAVTNALVAKELGLPPDTPITEGTLNAFRKEAGKPYAEISKLSTAGSDAIEKLKEARFMANKYKTYFDRSGDPAAYVNAKNIREIADKLEQHIENMANAEGRPDLVAALPKARTAIAKSYDIERALNTGSGEINAAVLGRKFDKVGEKGMTGELATIGKMQQAFKSAMREGGNVPSSGVSGTDAAASALLATVGAGTGGPAGLLAGGLPLLRGPARNLVLSPGYQQFATGPGLSPSRQAIIDALLQQGAGAAGTTVGRVNQ